MSLGKVTKLECEGLNDVLGDDSLKACSIYLQGIQDPMSVPDGDPFKGKDKNLYRNSWLWPKLARRLTKGSPDHVSNWQRPVEVDKNECAAILEALKAKGAEDKLPAVCK
eukprot:CAMPEP_0172487564 /NCGR_PEP_ID=MMETSP1066-20121228/16710_1 /TAXON_ID=671091 /ORGANISM="Coscinodiscus wailesii, Strain CCMP2513" /LENGTH=109 /DNA_ID=CAMNT_0013254261 /DNA_START=143 /DNA_END=472 /DNA_ORIENTATION=-